jgi:hypothetical protein
MRREFGLPKEKVDSFSLRVTHKEIINRTSQIKNFPRFIWRELRFSVFFYHGNAAGSTFGQNCYGMKNGIIAYVLAVCLICVGCNTATPEKYFDMAVLNVNTVVGFANDGMVRRLNEPSVKLVEGTKDQTMPMTRKETIEQEIGFIEEHLDKVKSLKETEDTKEILHHSIALYEYVLPVYKNEYTKLAALYDQNASKEQIQAAANAISEKYAQSFAKLHDQLMASGKLYAKKHQINVTWDVRTSPTL